MIRGVYWKGGAEARSKIRILTCPTVFYTMPPVQMFFGIMHLTKPMNEIELLLERWVNFYVITSAAAATLIGLLFVLITLAAERRLADTAKIRLYLTPTVIYFASVLYLAALLTFPNQTRFAATLCICLGGVAGLAYSGSLFIRRDVKKSYYELRHRIPYAGFPFAAYGLHVLGGLLLLHDPQRGLTLVASGMLSLLAVAIRNSWAIAIGVVSTPPGRH